jgi:hypothetical protein
MRGANRSKKVAPTIPKEFKILVLFQKWTNKLPDVLETIEVAASASKEQRVTITKEFG